MYRIVFLDGYAMNPGDLSMKGFEELGEVKFYERTAPEEVVERSLEADIVVVNKVLMTKEVFSRLPRLKMVCVSATGYNVIDLDEADRRGIVVCNAPDYSSVSVAQMVFALLLNVENHVDHYARLNREGVWAQSADFCYQDVTSHDVAGRTMGIVGMGNIGRRVAAIALAMGMRVITTSGQPQSALPEGVEKVSWDELTATSDVISLHVPQTETTTGLINASTLSRMKRSAVLINTARGGLVDEQALYEVLKSGRLRAYCADVMTKDPAPADNRLLTLPNVYVTPHIAWATREARTRLAEICRMNIARFIQGDPVNTVGKTSKSTQQR